jgi:transcriptional regulator with XRE-family HTH domain
VKAASPKRRRRTVVNDGPDPIDVFVGKRVRERRRQENLSQTALGSRLGVTFQAVQKYESGGIRISASTLYRLSHALDVEPGYFFEGYAEVSKPRKQRKR